MIEHFYKTVPLSAIRVPEDRARSLDKQWAEALAAMFHDHGNKVAIEVRKDGDGYVLVAGLHRLEAAKLCEWEELTVKVIEATSDRHAAEFRLHEVMENIGRRELTILDRAHHLYEFDKAMKELHPELKKGGNKQTEIIDENHRNEIFALRLDITEKVGLSQRSIQAAVKLWKSLSKLTRARLEGTWLADHQAGLMALASVGHKQQANILGVLFDPDNNIKTVADAIEHLENGRVEAADERRLSAAIRSFKKLDDRAMDAVLTANIERVSAWVKARGLG